MICSTLSGKLAIKHPVVGVLVREDGAVFHKKHTGFVKAYHWHFKKPTKEGYVRFRLNDKYYFVHRLVAECFCPNKDKKPEVDHINRIRSDNRASNLRWATRRENVDNSLTVLNRNPFITVRRCDNLKEYDRQLRVLKKNPSVMHELTLRTSPE